MSAMHSGDLIGGLPYVTTGGGPPLIVFPGSSRYSEISDTELFRSTAAGIRGARLILYPGRGHVGTMLDPHFGRDVAAFLRGQP
jgi:hypothetical protein